MVSLKIGDTKILRITVKNKSGEIKDLTGSQVFWSMSKKVNTSPIIEKTLSDGIVIDNPVTGILDIKILPTDTTPLSGSPGEYYHECKVQDIYGNKSTILDGKIILEHSLIK